MVVPGQHWSQDAVKEFERRIRAGGIPAHVAKDMGLPVGRPVFTRARSAGVNDLFLITGLFGDALKSLEADGIAVDDRSARLILDRFCDLCVEVLPGGSSGFQCVGKTRSPVRPIVFHQPKPWSS